MSHIDRHCYLLAAGKIHRPPSLCMVFEDAPMGLEAALAGGMKAIGVATTHKTDVLAKADVVVNRLDELDISELEALFG